MTELVNQAMDKVADLNKSAGVNLKGKQYTQVSTRVEVFRRVFGFDYSINTDIKPFGNGVIVKATVSDSGGRVVGDGHAYAASLQKEKSLEKLESTAIGRALASCGLSGGEYASISEIETWEERYEEPDHKKTQRDFLYEISIADDDWQIDAIKERVQESALPDDFKDFVNDAADSRLKQIENGAEAVPAFGFVNVGEAYEFFKDAAKQIQELDLDNLHQYMSENEHKIAALDKTLSAAKYQKDGKTPSQRLMSGYDGRMQARAAE